MKREYGDSVLIGASSVKHTDQVRVPQVQTVLLSVLTPLLQNLTDLEKGPLRKCLFLPIQVSNF